MKDQTIITLISAAIGASVFVAFHLHMRRLRRMTPSQRIARQANRDAWLGGHTTAARLYKCLVFFLLLCTLAHTMLTVVERIEVKRKKAKACGEVVAYVIRESNGASGKRYEIEVFNGSNFPIWVNEQTQTLATSELSANDDAVDINAPLGKNLTRINPGKSCFYTIPEALRNSGNKVLIEYSKNNTTQEVCHVQVQ